MEGDSVKQKARQQELFGIVDVPTVALSVSNAKMDSLMHQYGLVPTNDIQNSVAEMLLQHKDGQSISRLYAERFNAEASLAEKLLQMCISLLKESGEALCGSIDLVFWGKSCDVALVAFYEATLQISDPAMWTYPSRLKFICREESELERCRLLAEILFPNAARPFPGTVCDLADHQKIKEILSPRSFMTPRVHIASVEGKEELGLDVLKAISLSKAEKEVYLDYLAFDSDAKDIPIVADTTFGELFEQIDALNNNAFLGKIVTDERVERLRSYRMLRRILELSRSDGRNENFKIEDLIWKLAWMNKKLVPGKRFLDVYGFVQWLKPDDLSADCLAFYPKRDASLKVFVLKLSPFKESENAGKTNDDEMIIARKWLELCFRKTENSKIDDAVRHYEEARKGSVEWSVAYNDIRKFVVVKCWDPDEHEIRDSFWIKQNPSFLKWDLGAEVDLVDMYGVGFKGVRQLSQPDAEQAKIVYDRHQYRKVRGGPGTGKTLTMLWHAAQVVENRHLPAMILGKTNTLTGGNLKRFAATFSTLKNCSSEALKHQVEFSTTATFVCGYAQIIREECLRTRCVSCILRARDAAPQKKDFTSSVEHGLIENEKGVSPFFSSLQAAMRDCSDCNGEYCIARQMIEKKRALIIEEDRQKCCDACKKDFYRQLFSGNADLAKLKRKGRRAYGGVMVDECQSIPCEELQACYLITAVTNRWREFYMFCDEEQHFRGGALERDADSKKNIVRAPAAGFGRFITLTRNHRAYSKKLLSVYNAIQNAMSNLYDVESLRMALPENMSKGDVAGKVFFAQKGEASIFEKEDNGFFEIERLVSAMKEEIKSDTLLVLCDDIDRLRSWSVKSQDLGWVITHLPSAEQRQEERRLRLRFSERLGRVHLTGIDLSQGQTFENVLYISTQDQIKRSGGIEELFTALTRARAHLWIVDYSESGWLYEMLKGFNA